ncbi:MAG: NAD(P)-binding protein [Myxococcota bacterium]|nr:NAD(P)-binding protein [Myxococcota bacterium]
MTTKKKIGVIGGGASGCSLVWSLMRPETENLCEVTLFHDEDVVGGHSKTIDVWFDAAGKGFVDDATTPAPAGTKVYPVDIGVQFVCATLYPNLYRQLEFPEFKNQVNLTPHEALKISGSFSPTLNWGNFPEYQSGPRFEQCFDAATKELAAEFEKDIKWAPFTPLDGITFSTNMEQYLEVEGVPWSSNFFRYLMIPYLCIINGYGTTDLLETKFEDLFPIFVKIPGLQERGPYGSFTEPGRGWDRFTTGATSWVAAMADYGRTKGATLNLGQTVTAIYNKPDGTVVVECSPTADLERAKTDPSHVVPTTSAEFDEVVLTTDMTTNRALLDNAKNALYATQKDYISADKFALIPGVCYIHQDDDCLSPHLRDKKEDGQFVGAYSMGKTNPDGSNAYGLPYHLESSFQTYLMKNILGTPVDCHVSMYAEASAAKLPDPAKTIHMKTWRHGRWVASFFDKAKKDLHRIQGLGNIWFAGNNTTVDSEEGALVSAMIIAAQLFPEFRYPFPPASEAFVFFEYFQSVMFPSPSLQWRLGRIAADAGEHLRLIREGTAQ